MPGAQAFLRACFADDAAVVGIGQQMDWTIHHKATTISTNADARDGMPGEVYVADFQSAGRGRLDHKWIAPPGVNLMFSVMLDVAGHAPDEIPNQAETAQPSQPWTVFPP